MQKKGSRRRYTVNRFYTNCDWIHESCRLCRVEVTPDWIIVNDPTAVDITWDKYDTNWKGDFKIIYKPESNSWLKEVATKCNTAITKRNKGHKSRLDNCHTNDSTHFSTNNYGWKAFVSNKRTPFHLYHIMARLSASKIGDEDPRNPSVIFDCETNVCQILMELQGQYTFTKTEGDGTGDTMDRRLTFTQTYCICTPSVAFRLDGERITWFLNQLLRSRCFRKQFISSYLLPLSGSQVVTDSSRLTAYFLLTHPSRPRLDTLGNSLVNSYVLVRCEMETALSWLSTLGGAFSALGDLSTIWAEEAGRISIKQLKIALKLQDPLITSRCRLYTAISLLQRGQLKRARWIVKREYNYALSLPEGQDPKLLRMCLGVWAKLQYAWNQRYCSIKHKTSTLSNSVWKSKIEASVEKCTEYYLDNGKTVGITSHKTSFELLL